jgi:hypothetical protein
MGAALANEPSPANVAITTSLVLKGNSFVHLRNQERESIFLEVSPGPLSNLQFPSRRVKLRAGAAADVNLGRLSFHEGRQRLHILTKLFDSRGAPAGIGPFLSEWLVVSATEIRKVSDDGAPQSKESRPPGEIAFLSVPSTMNLETFIRRM